MPLRDSPKSDIFNVLCSSMRMLRAAKSRCVICRSSKWRMPRAICMAKLCSSLWSSTYSSALQLDEPKFGLSVVYIAVRYHGVYENRVNISDNALVIIGRTHFLSSISSDWRNFGCRPSLCKNRQSWTLHLNYGWKAGLKIEVWKMLWITWVVLQVTEAAGKGMLPYCLREFCLYEFVVEDNCFRFVDAYVEWISSKYFPGGSAKLLALLAAVLLCS